MLARMIKPFGIATVIALVIAGAGLAARAEDWPTKPIHLIHGLPAGSTADTLTRRFADDLSAILGQPIIVEPKPGGGAGGIISMNAIYAAAPDGYTLLIGTSGPMGAAPALAKLPWDPAKDFATISQISEGTFLLCAAASLGVETVPALVTKVRANPGKYNYGSQGVGSSPHLGFELIKLRAGGLDLVHIPYKGSSEIFAALLSGEIHLMLNSYNRQVQEMVKDGKVKVLAVAGPHRIPELPDLPTMAEAGVPGIDVRSWYGLVAPKGLPTELVTRINRAAVAALARPELVAAFKTGGQSARSSTPEEFRTLIAEANRQWRDVVHRAGIKLEN